MIVHADHRVRKKTLDFFAEIRSLSGIDLLVAFGQFESGVLDALSPHEDRYDAPVRALRYAAASTARSVLEGTGRPALGPIAALQLPEAIDVSRHSAFTQHALYPEMYAEAAREFHRNVQPSRTVAIGLRGAATSLSAVVAATVDAAMSATMRPGATLAREFAERLRWQRDAHFLIVGADDSADAYDSTAQVLRGLGVPEERIVLLPGYPGAGARYFDVRFEDVILPLFGEARDLSAGRWRELFWKDASQYPATHPHDERRKYLRDGMLLKFAGQGAAGRDKLPRARQLAKAGFSPEVVGFDNGFLCSRWEEGTPLQPGIVTLDLIQRIAAYLALIARDYPAAGPVPYDDLVSMVETNSGARLPKWDRALIEDAALVAVDGRMLPHEWIRTQRGFLKTDAIDHHSDHPFPGCQDIAWDLAGAIVECGIPREALVSEYLKQASDRTLTRRLPFYMRAYLAHRLGYARVAAKSLANRADGARFEVLGTRYSAMLRQLLP